MAQRVDTEPEAARKLLLRHAEVRPDRLHVDPFAVYAVYGGGLRFTGFTVYGDTLLNPPIRQSSAGKHDGGVATPPIQATVHTRCQMGGGKIDRMTVYRRLH
jgi:hypothetical protein